MERESIISKHETSSYEAIVVPFVKEAVQEGAHKIKPESLSEDRWNRQRNIGGIYIASPAIYKDLTKLAGLYRIPLELRRTTTEPREVTTEQVRQIIQNFLINLWKNCSPELQERYALDDILTARKPWGQRSRERLSASQGGKSLRVREQIESGVTDVGKISENLRIPKKQIMHSISLLKKWGIDINISRDHPSHKEVLKQLAEETDDKKIQELLDDLAYFVIANDMRKKREGSKFRALSNLIGKAGFCPSARDTHLFATTLKNAGVPISIKDKFLKDGRRQTYYTVLSRDKDRAIQVLKEDQNLQRFQENPVQLMRGPEDAYIPTTNELVKKQGYETVGRVFKELGVRIGGRSKLQYSDILTVECPVGIYCYVNVYYYSVDQEDDLRSFITKKLNLS